MWQKQKKFQDKYISYFKKCTNMAGSGAASKVPVAVPGKGLVRAALVNVDFHPIVDETTVLDEYPSTGIICATEKSWTIGVPLATIVIQ